MKLWVLDAGVAAKWVLPSAGETLVEEAVALLEAYQREQIRFTVPDLFWAELANLLWKSVGRRRCTRETAETALTTLKSRKLPTVPSLAVIEPAFAIANAFSRTVYDSIYIALAAELSAEFVTADERLANAVAAHLPVKWLGSLSPPLFTS